MSQRTRKMKKKKKIGYANDTGTSLNNLKQ